MSILLQGGRFKKRLMPILLSVALAGCSNLFGSSFTQTLQRDANASSEFYMNKLGQTQDKEDQQTYKLLAARVLISENKVPQAEELLTELVDLNEAQQLDRTLIEARIAAAKGNNLERVTGRRLVCRKCQMLLPLWFRKKRVESQSPIMESLSMI